LLHLYPIYLSLIFGCLPARILCHVSQGAAERKATELLETQVSVSLEAHLKKEREKEAQRKAEAEEEQKRRSFTSYHLCFITE
jgi:hypothetical protein